MQSTSQNPKTRPRIQNTSAHFLEYKIVIIIIIIIINSYKLSISLTSTIKLYWPE